MTAIDSIHRALPSQKFAWFYVAYVASNVGDNLWLFAVLFILEELGSMRLVGIYQLTEGFFVMFLSAYVWKWMDKYNRRKGTLTVLALNNLAIVVSALFLVGCLTVSTKNQVLYVISLMLSIVFCAFSKCAGEGEKLSFTKDWIVVMARYEGMNGETVGLSNKNAAMTMIEQTAQIVAPLTTSYILAYDYRWACFVFIGANFVCWIVEHVILARIYDQTPALHSRRDRQRTATGISSTVDAAATATISSVHEEYETVETKKSSVGHNDRNLWEWLKRISLTFWNQEVFSAGICLALMFMTVLGFDGLSISYGKAYGLSDILLGWFKSAAALLGVVGVLAYSFLEKRIGVKWTGIFGLTIQQVFLAFCIVSIFLPGSLFDPSGYVHEFTFASWWSEFKSAFTVSSPAAFNSTHLLTTTTPNSVGLTRSPLAIVFYFIGVTFARIGVWITDLAIMQIMQEAIREEDRLSVFGVENALCQFFFLGKDIMAILLPDPRTYGLLIIVSVFFVLSGFGFYVFYFFKTRKSH
ncbi:Solute carrier family 40 protein [Aphelenchoides besseyi]|nr:Solute carrier family 40 protein [Aphelenchoides besseyi]